MAKRIFKTFFIGVILSAVMAFSAAFSGCVIETNHPEVKITVEFNSETYELTYKMYRNMYPQTVRHFIELADSGFYDDVIVHDYTSTDWFTGGYAYDEERYAAALSGEYVADYLSLDDICKEDAYSALADSLTASVYRTSDASSSAALPTLMGEFSSNIDQEIENGALSAAYGTLKMYYYAKQTTQQVYVTPTSKQVITAMYKNNCATSLFMMQVGSGSSYTATNYCTFAEIKDSDPLDDLLEAVSDYISDNYDATSDFTASASVLVDNNDEFSNSSITDRGISQTFSVPVKAIVIRSVKVTKY